MVGTRRDVEAPNFYQLVGLELFEDGPHAVDDRGGPGPGTRAQFSARSAGSRLGRLLDELAAAKSCFRDPVRKAAYDDRLRQAGSLVPTSESPGSPSLHVAPINLSPDLYPPGMPVSFRSSMAFRLQFRAVPRATSPCGSCHLEASHVPPLRAPSWCRWRRQRTGSRKPYVSRCHPGPSTPMWHLRAKSQLRCCL